MTEPRWEDKSETGEGMIVLAGTTLPASWVHRYTQVYRRVPSAVEERWVQAGREDEEWEVLVRAPSYNLIPTLQPNRQINLQLGEGSPITSVFYRRFSMDEARTAMVLWFSARHGP